MHPLISTSEVQYDRLDFRYGEREKVDALLSKLFFEGQSCAIKHFLAHVSPLFPRGYLIQNFVLLTNSLRSRDNPSDSLRLKRHAIMSAFLKKPASRPDS